MPSLWSLCLSLWLGSSSRGDCRMLTYAWTLVFSWCWADKTRTQNEINLCFSEIFWCLHGYLLSVWAIVSMTFVRQVAFARTSVTLFCPLWWSWSFGTSLFAWSLIQSHPHVTSDQLFRPGLRSHSSAVCACDVAMSAICPQYWWRGAWTSWNPSSPSCY